MKRSYLLTVLLATSVRLLQASQEFYADIVPICNGAGSVSVTNLCLSFRPGAILLTVEASGSDDEILYASLVGCATTNGFTANLSGLTDSQNYRLHYVIYEGKTEPVDLSIQADGPGQALLKWNVKPNSEYEVQTSTNLSLPSWLTITNILTEYSGVQELEVAAPLAAQFWRVNCHKI